MGTWGHSAFENDAASDWLADLYDAGNIAPVEKAIRAALPEKPSLLKKLLGAKANTYLDADVASVALVAAEVLAALRGNPHASIPQELADFLQTHESSVSDELYSLAIGVVSRIGIDSELCELWQEAGEFVLWKEDLDLLVRRIVG
ncbi:DUF4259 domain-containing protein [Burkholderiaceae bacterium DAT-1]|nr:DUF4259 domain-containing protein [Burkholderiaceae bacterium DAT-1]